MRVSVCSAIIVIRSRQQRQRRQRIGNARIKAKKEYEKPIGRVQHLLVQQHSLQRVRSLTLDTQRAASSKQQAAAAAAGA